MSSICNIITLISMTITRGILNELLRPITQADELPVMSANIANTI